MNEAALLLAVAGIVLGVLLLFRPNERTRLGFYGCILGSVVLRIILAVTRKMDVHWMDVVIGVALAAGIVLQVREIAKRKGSDG